MIDCGVSLARDRRAVGAPIGDDKELIVERINDRRGDRREGGPTEMAAILHEVPTDQPKSDLVIALGSSVEVGEPPVCPALGVARGGRGTPLSDQ